MAKIAIGGASGFLGTRLKNAFTTGGHQVLAIPRDAFNKGVAHMAKLLEGSEAVVHLSGAPILKRWTRKHKNALWASRIDTTKLLSRAISRMDKPPATFICASAVGIYPEHGRHDESSLQYTDGFLGKLCQAWEEAARTAPCRVLNFRFGIILDKSGGALKQMALPFKLGLGGVIGSGRQMMSWVHSEDVVRIVHFALENNNLKGPVNVVAPQAVTNKTFTRRLASALKRPALIPIPSLALRLLYGEGASVLTKGQEAIPEKLTANGFRFRFPDLQDALKNIY